MYIALIFNNLKQHLSWKLSYLDNEKEMLLGNCMRFCPKFTKIGPVTILFSVRIYRAVLSKCEIFIKMRVAESRPSFDIEKSLFNKKPYFFNKNHFLFYYLKLEMSIFTNF